MDMNGTDKPKFNYYEYEGYLVSKPELPYVGTNIFQGGKWKPITIANGDTELFPMSEADADNIIRNGYPKITPRS